LNCRFRISAKAEIPTNAWEAEVVTDACEVEPAVVVLNGACWLKFTFVMLSVNGDEEPVYVHRRLV
jgi:hypothetical protein